MIDHNDDIVSRSMKYEPIREDNRLPEKPEPVLPRKPEWLPSGSFPIGGIHHPEYGVVVKSDELAELHLKAKRYDLLVSVLAGDTSLEEFRFIEGCIGHGVEIFETNFDSLLSRRKP